MRKGIEELVLEFINNEHYNPMTKKEVANIFVTRKDDVKIIYSILDKLNNEGKIFINRNKVNSLRNSEDYVQGIISIKKKGFAFLYSEELDEEFFISSEDRNGAYDGDLVIAKIIKYDDYIDDFGFYGQDEEQRSREAFVHSILKRNNTEMIGTLDYRKGKKFGFVEVDNFRFDDDIFVPERFLNGAKNGDKVVCKIYDWDGNKPEAKIIEVLGQSGGNEVEVMSIIKAHNLPTEFSDAVMSEVDKISDCVLESDLVGRTDFRDELTYTIDGDDSKDFDDAISVRKLDDGNYELGVHIADVCHYVKEGSYLDKEAVDRATSVYLVDQVIPMLPKKLSNGICSLNPNVDRLTLSCVMKVDYRNGSVIDYKILQSVINSKARMTYTEVSDLLENDDIDMKVKYKDFEKSLREAKELADILFKKRIDKGAIEFDFAESKIVLDGNKNPIKIEAYERRTSNRMIEEFMLLANETVAKHFCKMNVPFAYRVHEVPEDEKMAALKDFAHSYNIVFDTASRDVRPMDIQKMLNSIEDETVKKAVSMVVLRTLRQARYTSNNLEHFGLAAEYYSHFTSPIRRYPDLQIHRIIKEVLNGEFSSKRKSHYESILDGVCTNSSEKERNAEVCERSVKDFYNALYMKKHEGEKFEGFVSGVTNFGVFVELDNGIEGLTRLSALPKYYSVNEKYFSMTCHDDGDVIKLGQRKEILVDFVDIKKRQIDFKIVFPKMTKM